MTYNIKLDSSTVDFKFGDLDVQANLKDENVIEMLKVEVEDEQKEMQDAIDRINKLETKDITSEDYETVIEAALEAFDGIYTPVFGKGTVKEVYQMTGSITSTLDAFDQAVDHIIEVYDNKKKRLSNKYRKRKK